MPDNSSVPMGSFTWDDPPAPLTTDDRPAPPASSWSKPLPPPGPAPIEGAEWNGEDWWRWDGRYWCRVTPPGYEGLIPPPVPMGSFTDPGPAPAIPQEPAGPPPPLRWDPEAHRWVIDYANGTPPPPLPEPQPFLSLDALPLRAPLPDLVPGYARDLNPHRRAPLSLTGEDPEWDTTVTGVEPAELPMANVVTSRIKGQPDLHHVVLDIDLPALLLPSSTPGHHHLYIDKPMHWDVYTRLLDALAEAGVIEMGYARASKIRGYTSLRLPWVTKTADEKGGSG